MSQQEIVSELATTALNLETASDAISSLVAQAHQLHANGLAFSENGWIDLLDFHDQVRSNTQLALSLLMTGAPDIARQLLLAKDKVRGVEQT